MAIDVIWLAVCVAVAAANVACAISNYWAMRRNGAIETLEGEIDDLREAVDIMINLYGSEGMQQRYDGHCKREYRDDEGGDGYVS